MSSVSHRLLIVCFCAAWCRTCDDYAHVVSSLKAHYAAYADVVWVDIEDQAEVLDEIDVENFPTLLISDPRQVYFWGPVLPYAGTALQLIDRVLAGEIRCLADESLTQLDQRLRTAL